MNLDYLKISFAVVVILIIVYLQWFKPNTIKKNKALLLAIFFCILFVGYATSHKVTIWTIILPIILLSLGIYEDYRRNKRIKNKEKELLK